MLSSGPSGSRLWSNKVQGRERQRFEAAEAEDESPGVALSAGVAAVETPTSSAVPLSLGTLAGSDLRRAPCISLLRLFCSDSSGHAEREEGGQDKNSRARHDGEFRWLSRPEAGWTSNSRVKMATTVFVARRGRGKSQ